MREESRLRRGPLVGLLWVVVVFITLPAIRLLTDSTARQALSTTLQQLNERSESPVGEIVAGMQVGQTFLSTRSNLNQIDVKLATYARENGVALVLTVGPYPHGPSLRSVLVQPDDIRDNLYHGFPFRPIKRSKGRTFVAMLSSPEGQPGDAFTAWISNCDCYSKGAAVLNGDVLLGQDLAVRVGYRVPTDGTMKELRNRLSQYKPVFFKDPVFSISVVAFFALGVFGVRSLILKASHGHNHANEGAT